MGELKILGGGGGVAGLKTLQYEYTGSSRVDYIEEEIDGSVVSYWALKLLSSGTLKIISGNALYNDLYVVGGGGGGGGGTGAVFGGGGGGGGYIESLLDTRLEYGKEYSVIIGSGGAAGLNANLATDVSQCDGGTGGESFAFDITASGGGGGLRNGPGGAGGSGGGPSATNPYSSITSSTVGKGSGKTTKIAGTLYCGGGAGGGGSPLSYGGAGGSDGSDGYVFNAAGQTNGAGGAGGGGSSSSLAAGTPGTINSGGGGGGGYSTSNTQNLTSGGAGGSGIVIIVGRNY